MHTPLVTALSLTPRFAVLLLTAVDDFLPHVGPGEGKLQEEMGALLTALEAANDTFVQNAPDVVEGNPFVIDIAGCVDLCWGTLAQVVEEWIDSPKRRRGSLPAHDLPSLVRLFNAAEGQP